MQVLLFTVFALAGLAFGSFLNVCIDRLPAGKSLISPPSHCDVCGRRLVWYEMVPVFSFLLLRARCRSCGAHIPWRVFWVELGTSALLVLLFWRFGLTADLGIAIFYSCIFMAIALIDLEHQLILNRIVYPAALCALLISLLLHRPPVLSSIIGGAIGFVLLLVIVMVSRGGMGFGDVKMAGLIGLAVGFPMVFVSLLVGIILGGLTAIVLLLFRIKKRKEVMPFGPFLSLAAVITLLWGSNIMQWYLCYF
jgi:leader peptidase (prepilin peptidase) / N-methyltransferase